MARKHSIASVYPIAIPEYTVDTEGDEAEKHVSKQSFGVASVFGTRDIGLLCKAMDKIPIVEAKRDDVQEKGFQKAPGGWQHNDC